MQVKFNSKLCVFANLEPFVLFLQNVDVATKVKVRVGIDSEPTKFQVSSLVNEFGAATLHGPLRPREKIKFVNRTGILFHTWSFDQL
jgi:hypothetical protein